MFSDLMSPCATLRARASRRAVSSWKAIHFFSIGLRKGRVLRTGRGRGSVAKDALGQGAYTEGDHAPYAIVEIAREPLADEIPRLFRLHKSLIIIHIRYIEQRVPFD